MLDSWPSCVEFACSPRVCMCYLWVFQLPPASYSLYIWSYSWTLHSFWTCGEKATRKQEMMKEWPDQHRHRWNWLETWLIKVPHSSTLLWILFLDFISGLTHLDATLLLTLHNKFRPNLNWETLTVMSYEKGNQHSDTDIKHWTLIQWRICILLQITYYKTKNGH